MPSIVWGRNPEEAYANPYEYNAQNQFVREAGKLLNMFYQLLDRYARKFHRDDTSIRKAIWMLQIDALDALRECLEMLQAKKHRIAGRLFRGAIETLDLAAYFHSNTPQSNKSLKKWYQNEIISHRECREFMRKSVSKSHAKIRCAYYSDLSKFMHRTYRILLKSYILGQGNFLVCDSTAANGLLVLPHTIAAYYTVLADIIAQLSGELTARELLSKNEVKNAWKTSLGALALKN